MITWDRGVSVLSKYTKYYNSNSYEPLSEGGCTITMDRRWLVYCQNTLTIVIHVGMNHSLSEGGWAITWDRKWLLYCQNTRTIVICMNNSLSEGGWVIMWDRGPSASLW